MDVAPPEMAQPSAIRTVIAADFDNDGYEELFFNNIGDTNRLFRQVCNESTANLTRSILYCHGACTSLTIKLDSRSYVQLEPMLSLSMGVA